MASSSFYKNTGTSTQLQTTAASSAAAAAASQAAALASENAASTSETNAAASAAAALVSRNAAANSAANAASDASAASISATASQTAATSSSANAALTSADATQTAADRVQTGLDRIATAADAVQTAADRVQTGLDVTSSSASAAAALSSRNAAATSETNAAASAASSSADATATAADRVQTGLDAASTAADALATAADRVQTGLDVTAAGTSATNAATSASAAASDATAAAASAASAANSYDLFDDRYLGSKTGYATAQTGPALDNDGNALVAGTLFFSADANEMRVYDGAGWIAASSAGSSSLINYHYTATAAQTTFSGSDDNSNTLSYTVDNLIVTKNGIVLETGTDYTATNGTSVVLAVAAAAGDEINVVAFKSFTTADMVSATNGGTFQSNVTVNGTMTATSFSGDGSALTGITIPTLSSLGIANHDQVTVTAGGAVTATSFSGDGSSLTGIPTPTLTSLGIDNHDDITVDGSGNVGIGVSSPPVGLSLQGNTADKATVQIKQTATGGKDYRLTSRDDGTFRINDDTAGAVRLSINGNGGVGIGVSNAYPAKLQIAATNATNAFNLHSTTGNIEGYAQGNSANTTNLQTTANHLMFQSYMDNGGRAWHQGTQLSLRNAHYSSGTPHCRLVLNTSQGGYNNGAMIHAEGAGGYNQGTLVFSIGWDTDNIPDEIFRIRSNKMLIGTGNNNLPDASVAGAGFDLSNASELRCSHFSTGNSTQIRFLNPNGEVGAIRTNGTATNYLTSSDYRLKENITADWDATTRLKQLNPVRFNFIADADTTVDGFLAHEVQDIVPEAISGTKDGMVDEEYEVTPAIEATYDEEGNVLTEYVPPVMGTRSVPDYQGIDQSKLVPLLVKTIQELEARIAALENA